MRGDVLYDKGFLVNYYEGDSALYRTPLNYINSINDRYHTIKEDETLLQISQQYYDFQYLWYILADVNSDLIEDIFNLPFGEVIIIPDLGILDNIYG